LLTLSIRVGDLAIDVPNRLFSQTSDTTTPIGKLGMWPPFGDQTD